MGRLKTLTSVYISSVLLIGCSLLSRVQNDSPTQSTEQTVRMAAPRSQPSSSGELDSPEEAVPFTASFEIITLGTKRIFTNPMYHHQSEDVYIESPDPSIINVHKTSVTWNDFFKTLPFSITKECLITGTKQTFCTNQSGTLRFFLNDTELPDALDKEIQVNDHLIISYQR